MKKMTTLLMLLTAFCLVLGAAQAEGAPQQPVAVAHKIADVKIDGLLTEWNLDSPMVLDNEYQVIRDLQLWMQEKSRGEHTTAKVYAAWDAEFFYFAADVTENNPFGTSDSLLMEGQDNIQLYLSTNPADDPARKEYLSNDFKMVFVTARDMEYCDTCVDRTMVAKANRGRFISKGTDGGEQIIDGYEYFYTLTTTGYIYEAKIPWSFFTDGRNIKVYTPAVGDTVNFNVVVTDIDYVCPGTTAIPQIAWSALSNINQDPSGWGRLTFAE